MANILLTTRCNRACSYCFAREKVAVGGNADMESSSHMTMGNFEKVITFLKRSDTRVVSLLGGEPTLNPDFRRMAQHALDAGLAVKVFTNALMPMKTAEYLASADGQINTIVNLNHPSETPPDEWRHENEVLSLLGERASISCNIYRPDQDLTYAIKTIRKHNLNKKIRLGLAMPILGAENSYLPLDSYREVGRMLSRFSSRGARYDISLNLDCGFVLCMFTPAEVGRMVYNNAEVNMFCSPVIDIGPDLNVWSCFPLSRLENVRLEDFETRQQIVEYYNRKFSAFKRVGSMPKCVGCPQLRRQQCYGGCVVHTMRSFNIDQASWKGA